MPVLPLFSVSCLILISLQQTGNLPLVDRIADPWLLYLGWALVPISAIRARFRPAARGINYDLFALGTLFLWFAQWRHFYRLDAPIFTFYPIFFVLLTAGVTLAFINRHYRIDEETKAYLTFLDRFGYFKAPLLAGLALAGVLLPQHFTVYPILLSILTLRYALDTCLERIQAPQP